MCILGGDWRFPDEGQKKKPARRGTGEQPQEEVLELRDCVKDVIRACLKVEPKERPDIDQLAGLVEDAIRELPRDEQDVDDVEEEEGA